MSTNDDHSSNEETEEYKKYTMGWFATWFSSRAQKKYHDFYYWVGFNMWMHPCRFIALGLLIVFIFLGGFMFVEEETRNYYLFIPRDSKVWSQYKEIVDYFGSIDATQVILFEAKDGSILKPELFDEMLDAYYRYYDNVTAKSNGDTYIFTDLCKRSYPTAPLCYDRDVGSSSSNLFGFFDFNKTNWQTENDILTIVNLDDVPVEFYVGGIKKNDSGYIISAEVLRISYSLEGTSNDDRLDAIDELQWEFQEYWDDHKDDYDDLNIYYFTNRSFDDEIGRLVSADIPIYIAALIVMLTYLSFTLGKMDRVRGRPCLSLMALVVLIGGLILSFGIGGYFGHPYNTIVLLVPYILLGIGVDDMIILVDAFDNSIRKYGIKSEDQSLRAKQLGEALSHVALSVSLTSYCSVAAFLTGLSITLPGIKVFCIYAAVAFAANHILQWLLFVPALTFSQKRISAKRNICCWCIKHDNYDLLASYRDLEVTTSNTNDENTPDSDSKGSNDEETPPTTPLKEKKLETNDKNNKNDNSKNNKNNKKEYAWYTLSFIVKNGLIPFLSNRIYRIITIVIFMLLFIGACFCVQRVEVTSDSARLVPDDSYVLDFIDVNDDAFDNNFLQRVYVILRDIDLSDKEARDSTYDLISAIEDTKWAIPPTIEWLSTFDNDYLPSKNLSVNNLTKSEYYHHLQSFANDSVNAYWDSEIVYKYDNNDEIDYIKATRLIMLSLMPSTVIDQWPIRNKLTRLFDDYLPDNGFIWEYNWGFSFLAVSVTNLTINNLITATLAVFGCLFFLIDIRNAFFILCVVIIIDIDLFAWMFLCGIILDSVAFAQLVMAVGLTVDYIIHTSHAIQHVKPWNIPYQKRLEIAMMDMGVSVIKGGWTTFLGCLALAFSASASFRSFFALFAGIIIISLLHGLIFVPAFLGEIFEIYNHFNHPNAQDKDNQVELAENMSNKENNKNKENNNETPVTDSKAEIVYNE